MRQLFLDVESYSSVDLKKAGAARYFASPDFEIILQSYKWVVNGIAGPTVCVDTKSGEEIPDSVFWALTDPLVEKHAFNALFEIGAYARQYDLELDIRQWKCTMVHAQYCGLPAQLSDVCKVLKTQKRKDFRGSNLIRTFCVPCKPTKKNGMRTRNLPHHDPARWALFKDYNILDVESEYEVEQRLDKVPVPETEWEHWYLDSRMNARGVKVDLQLVRQAIKADAVVKKRLTAEAVALTKLSNPNSVKQLKEWLTEELDFEIKTLNKDTIPQLINMSSLDDRTVERVLKLRVQLGKSSVTKYHAMERSADELGYIRGLTQFYGANRTGRAAGRLVQLQNLRKNSMPTGYYWDGKEIPSDELLLARDMLLAGDIDLIQLFWGDVIDVLSQLVRTALIADDDCIFAPVDFSAIEARKLAWAADETWRLDVFKTHGMIYEASAAKMFGVPLDSILKKVGKEKVKGPNYPLRAKGKIAELALGYQGGEGALVRMGALDMGLTLNELDPIKVAWRAANLMISGQSYRNETPGLWELMNEAAMRALRLKNGQLHEVKHGIGFRYATGCLFMRLPSGRELVYCKAKIADGDYGDEVHFWGQNQVTKQWEEQKSYGGRWTENFCQASSRDLLYAKLRRMEEEGLHQYVRFHVHDEAVLSVPIHGAGDTLRRIQDIFGEEVRWAPGLPLRGDGFLTPVFRKDD